MVTVGNTHKGILRHILDVIYATGQSNTYDSDWIAKQLVNSGVWRGKSSRTPERSVNMYFSQNRELFEHVGRNRYRLREVHHRADPLEMQFEQEALAIYETAKQELRYNATRFLQAIRNKGGVSAAKSWLRNRRTDKPTNGFLRLVDAGMLESSVEALALRDPYSKLFTAIELDVARNRLKKYGYFEPKGKDRIRTHQLPEQIDDQEYYEGAAKTVKINRYERNAKAGAACIRHYGPKCYVCKFSFTTYGDAFNGFIHVHHLCSLASIGKNYVIDPVADLRPVCPNCHAIIHRRVPCFSIEEVRKMLGIVGPEKRK